MPVLQINQEQGKAPNHYRISVSASEIPDHATLHFDTSIEFEVTPEDRERIRWYLEEYLDFDQEPAPQIARGVEAFMAGCGEELFCKIFAGSDAATALWSALERHLSTTRIEISAGIAAATAIPWELIRNPRTNTSLALSAAAFVRSQGTGEIKLPPASEAAKVRILLIICRPKGGKDAPFRSVAGRLITRLNEEARNAFELHVLRPPTYEQLGRTLERARDDGVPFHVVHFDGHGIYADANALALGAPVVSSLTRRGELAGRHGFLAFENPANRRNAEFVEGFELGALLRDTGVPVLVLNACQSAFVEARPQPTMDSPAGTRQEVEAYGSLAQAVIEAGAAGVVAMRYSVLVSTAARFVAELYGALARGRRLGEAVASARRNLRNRSDRKVAYEPRPLQDWSVPVVWERAPLQLWPKKLDAGPLAVTLEDGAASTPGALDQALPARPDVGFYGRDETLYALDRAFDTHRIVLLHAYAGSGKTSTAREFAVWYQLTGGLAGPVLFTSFERHLPLARVLDKIGMVFADVLKASKIQWEAVVDSDQRRRIALLLLQQIPVLWIWDNIEPITGFPAGTGSDWSAPEQDELLAFLRTARDTTQARFLLTSRRDEEAWLDQLVLRVGMPEMPMQERLQFAGAIVAQRNKRLAELPHLGPLLKFTRGNPMTILITVGEALRAGIGTQAQLDAFVQALQNREINFEDEKTEGRSKSLGASLSYGFGAAFSDDERKILALLHLFQGLVDVAALRMMGAPGVEWCLEAIRGLTKERSIALLDRAGEIGLLEALGSGAYGIHPALPWYFRALFEKYFPEATGEASRARRAFAQAMGELGSFYHQKYNQGHRELLDVVAAQEDNMLTAWHFARAGGWWPAVVSVMQGLRVLYITTGRRAAWRRLIEDVIPDFVDPKTDGPLHGREADWRIVTEYRLRLAREDRDWEKAASLQQLSLDWDRQRAQPILKSKPGSWDAEQRNEVRMLGVSLQGLAEVQLLENNAASAEVYRESLAIDKALGDVAGEAVTCFNLGRVYTDVTDLRDLDEAERWYGKSLELRLPSDGVGVGKTLGQLGFLSFQRFEEAHAAGRPASELRAHLDRAEQLFRQVLNMLPANAVTDLATTHVALGNIRGSAGDINGALDHYHRNIYYCELDGDIFNAGGTRYNVAVTLVSAGRFADARVYAEAALANYLAIANAADHVKKAKQLIADIDRAIAEKTGGL
jgi:tetratricopeptide (TPR) repeat protein